MDTQSILQLAHQLSRNKTSLDSFPYPLSLTVSLRERLGPSFKQMTDNKDGLKNLVQVMKD